jgi:hypothetical protein
MLEAHHVPAGDAPAAGGSSEPVDPACAPSPPTVTGATTTSDFATAFLSKYDDDEDPGTASGGFVVRVIGPRGMNAMRSANLQVCGVGGGVTWLELVCYVHPFPTTRPRKRAEDMRQCQCISICAFTHAKGPRGCSSSCSAALDACN